MENISILKLYRLYIKNTKAKSPVVDKITFVCNATNAVAKACSLKTVKIYINTRIIKHLYDGKTAEEFMFLINNIHTIVKYPDYIYKNRESKRGDYAFVKTIDNSRYLASIEIVENIVGDIQIENANFIVTCFRLRKINYLKNYNLMWSWKGDTPSS